TGTNLQALLDAARDPSYPARIVLVVSNRPDAGGLERAARAGVPTRVIPSRAFADREAYDAALDEALREAEVELVCLAGFMRVLGRDIVERWRDRMLNIHPSLLPAFRGLETHARVLEAGLPVTGCTVHFVRPEIDEGPVIVQGVVPVLPGDTVESLNARVLEVEHRCYPRALALVAGGRTKVIDERVATAQERPFERLILHPDLSEACR
ncbi:MAG TPA: phosphoribosylglycinamide formyltransferase, partial [Rhodospirillales bacterium]|nr:phosphoribosylglycinamide formyltransferase [Rhodospirillales bacterium]